MTLNQATKRLEKVALQLDLLRGRVEALTKDMAIEKPRAAKAPSNGKSNGKRTQRPSPIGATINYGGLQGKVLERKGDKFIAEMSDGKRRQVSAVYVYRQLSKKSKAAPKVKHDTSVAEDVAATVIANQQAAASAPQDQPAKQEKVA